MSKFGDLWSDYGGFTKSSILMDFDDMARPKIKSGVEASGGRRLGQAEALIKIERCVETVMRSKKPAYVFKGKVGEQVVETGIGRRLKEVLPLAWQFTNEFVYSEKPSAFLRACRVVKNSFDFSLSRNRKGDFVVDCRFAEAMNRIVDLIRMLVCMEWFKRSEHDRRYEAGCKARALSGYTRRMLRSTARTLIVRLDLGYVGGASAQVTITRVCQDLEDFLYPRGFSPLFAHLKGYAWSIEQGKNGKGFHIHILLFFDGSKIRNDVGLGFALGNFWRNGVTRGAGTYRNCNAHKKNYKRCGIGMIHRDNDEECENAVEFAQYLPKGGPFKDRDDQYLRIRLPVMHAYQTGQEPGVVRGPGRPSMAA